MFRQQDLDDTRFPFHGKLFLRLLALSCLVSLAFIAVLGFKADWDAVFSGLDARWLAAAVAAMVLLQFISGYRLYRFLPGARQDGEGQILKSVKVMFLFQAAIKLLPFRLGEAGFFWLSKRYLDMPFRDSLGVFLGFRIWDLRVVALSFLLCGGMLLGDAVPGGKPLFAVVSAFGIGVFMLSSARLIRLAEYCFRAVFRITSFVWSQRLAASLSEAARTLDQCRSFMNSLANGVLSIVTWITFYAVFHCLYRSLGVDIGWNATIMVVSGMTLVGIIPIQTLGGIGLLEFGQASLLVLAGLTATEAAGKSLAAGALFLGLCLGVPALLFLAFGACERMVAGRQTDTP